MCDCEKIREYINFIEDRELSKPQISSVHSHLKECQSCRNYYEDIKIISTLLHKMQEIDPPENFTQSVMEKIKQEKTRKIIPISRKLAAIGTLAAIMCLTFFAMDYYSVFEKNKLLTMTSATPPYKADELALCDSLPENAVSDAEQSYFSDNETVREKSAFEKHENKSYYAGINMANVKDSFIVEISLPENITVSDLLSWSGIDNIETCDGIFYIDRNQLAPLKTVCDKLSVPFNITSDNEEYTKGVLIIN